MILDVIGYGILAILLIACGVVTFNHILLFSFLFVDYNVRSLYKPQEYPPASMWRYAKNFWIELFYVFGKYYLLPLKWINLTVKGEANATAILLIHGYCRHQSDWLWMRKQFKETSCPVYCVNLEPMLGPIQELASNKVAEKINLIKKQTGCKNIIMIGHSMGGVVANYYSEFLDTEKLITAVITIGSPLSGTRVAVFASGENGKQMYPGSQLLAQLHVPLHNSSKKLFQICSKFDQIIFPWQSALFEHTPPKQQFVMNFEGHLEMLHSKKVAAQLNIWIKELL